MYGESGNDLLEGGDGNDTLESRYGSNVLKGGAGDDSLTVGVYAYSYQIGGYVGSRLEGGTGNDTLTGSYYRDTYVFNRNDAQDTILTRGGNDVLEFGSGIDHDQLWFSQSGNDLLVQVIGSYDQTLITDWYSGSKNQVKQIRSGDGFTLVDTRVDLLVQHMAAFAPPASGELELSANLQTQLDPVLVASWETT